MLFSLLFVVAERLKNSKYSALYNKQLFCLFYCLFYSKGRAKHYLCAAGDAERAAGRWDNAENFYVESLKASAAFSLLDCLNKLFTHLFASRYL